MRRFTKAVMVTINLLIVTGTICAFLSRKVSPLENEVLPFFGLAFLGFLVSNVLFLFFWSIFRSRWVLLSILPLVIGASYVTDYIGLGLKDSDLESNYKLLSHNVRLFGYYEWDKNAQLRDSIVHRLEIEQADILCFQEFYFRDHGVGFQTMPYVLEATKTKYIHEKYTHEFKHDQYFGVVTMSKFPIVNRGFIAFESDANNYCIYSDIELPRGDTIRVFNQHLASIHFRKDEYGLLEGKEKEMDRMIGSTVTMMEKLKSGFQRRAAQIDAVMKEVELSPYPVILAGDFNDTPMSYTYGRCRESLEDSFTGLGLGNTYNGPTPFLRIDHVLHSADLDFKSYRQEKDLWSDHFPVICGFDIKH